MAWLNDFDEVGQEEGTLGPHLLGMGVDSLSIDSDNPGLRAKHSLVPLRLRARPCPDSCRGRMDTSSRA